MATAATVLPPDRRPAEVPGAPIPTAHRVAGRPAPTAGQRLRQTSNAHALAGVRTRSRTDGWRVAPRPLTSDRAGRADRRAADRPPGPGRQEPDARWRRWSSSEDWRWPDRSGRTDARKRRRALRPRWRV